MGRIEEEGMSKRVWGKGLGIVALAAILAIGGLAGRVTATSAQTMWYDPVTGLMFPFQNTVSAYPVTVTTSSANEPVINATGMNTYVAPSVSYTVPVASYTTGVASVYAPPTADWVNPGGMYCTLGNDQIWVPAGASPASYGC
jgi:hypothetical protein